MRTRLRTTLVASVLLAGSLALTSPVASASGTPDPPTTARTQPTDGGRDGNAVATPAQRILPTPSSLKTRSGTLVFDAASVIDIGKHPRASTVTVANALAAFLRTPPATTGRWCTARRRRTGSC